MVELRVLGRVSLKRPSGEDALPLLSQAKPLAVLTFLALEAQDGFVSRDRLLALFWPEAETSAARNALNQVLHSLRTELGAGSILSRGRREVGLNREGINCDAVAFLDAARAEENEVALGLYSGHLLDGFHLNHTPEFDNWLSTERERLREMAAVAAWAVAHAHLRAGRPVDAERTGQRALGLVCTDESEVRAFIEALARGGDRAGAIRFYEKFSQILEAELELEPDPRTRALVRELREKRHSGSWGGRVIPLQEGRSTPDSPEGVGGTEDEESAEEKGGRRFGGRLLPWALACLAGGWASTEAATFMVSRFDWPQPVGQVASLLIVMAAFGFFFALILAFYFGEKARGQATGPELLVVAFAMLAFGGILSQVESGRGLSGLVETGLAPGRTPDPGVEVLLLLPWETEEGRGEDFSFAEEIRSSLVETLSGTIGLQLLSPESSDSPHSPSTNPLERAAVEGATCFLSAALSQNEGPMSVSAQLISAEGGKLLWSGEVEHSGRNESLEEYRDRVVGVLAEGVRANLPR